MNPLRKTIALLRVLLDALRSPEEPGGKRRHRVSTPSVAECVNCAQPDGKHVVGCPKAKP